VKLVALYQQPTDPATFDDAYFQTHLPLIKLVPGLERTVISRFKRTVMGDGPYLMAEMYFADEEALKSAMRSPEMAVAGENLDGFAKGLVSLMFTEEL
jgi:uncharacterized protein (TIGR02118 family)